MEAPVEQTNPNLPDVDIQKKIEYRLNQSNGSRLAEVITGHTPEDPQIIDRLIEIQDRIYQKYSLPDISLSITNPNLLHQKLGEILTSKHIPLLTKDVTKSHFDKYPNMYAAYFKDLKGIGINTEKQKDPNYNHLIYYMCLSHETTHALQDLGGDFDCFGVELLEFEATITATPLSPLKDIDFRAKVPPEQLKASMVFMFDSMYASVENWEKQGGLTDKPHYTAENMLRVFDGVTDEQVNTYKNQIKSSKDK